MFRKLSVRTSIALARTSLFSAFAVLLLTSPALSQSISIPIPNYDFASPYVPDLSPFAEAGVSNWVQSPPPAWWTADGYSTLQWDDNVGVFINMPSEWIDNLVPSGGTAVHQQAAFMFSAPGLELSQTRMALSPSEVVSRAVFPQFGPERLARLLHEWITMPAPFENPWFETARAIGDFAGSNVAEHRLAMNDQLRGGYQPAGERHPQRQHVLARCGEADLSGCLPWSNEAAAAVVRMRL